MAEDWGQLLTAFGESLRVLPQLVEGVAAERLRREPAPGEWSARGRHDRAHIEQIRSALSG